MEKLRIVNIQDYGYNLQDENNKEYTFNLEFVDLEEKIDVGDIIFISNELLNSNYEGYSKSYTFGNMDSEYGKENLVFGDIDVIKVEKEGKEILLKRLYG